MRRRERDTRRFQLIQPASSLSTLTEVTTCSSESFDNTISDVADGELLIETFLTTLADDGCGSCSWTLILFGIIFGRGFFGVASSSKRFFVIGLRGDLSSGSAGTKDFSPSQASIGSQLCR